jgi:hypothetical protein
LPKVAVDWRSMATEDSAFEQVAANYGKAVDRVLAQSRRQRPDAHLSELLQKILATLYETRLAAREDTTGHARAVVDGLLPTLADSKPCELSRDSAAELLDCLERAAIRIGDERYLHAVVTSELVLLDQADAPIWKAVLNNERLPPPDVERGALKDGDHARAWLLSLQRTRGEWQRRRWVRLRLKSDLLRRLAIGLTILVVAAGAAAGVAGAEWKDTLLVVTTGALGAAVSGIYKLRDEIAAATMIRAFASTVTAQVAVGAAAGIFVLLLIETGVLHVGGDAHWAALGAAAFAAGFSEPFLLGLVRRVASSR